MPVYRCNRCGRVAEEAGLAAGTRLACGQCQAPVTLFTTTFYIEKLIERYASVRRELEVLKQQEDDEAAPSPASPEASVPADLQLLKDQLQNTQLLATEAQHQPLQAWFAAKHLQCRVDLAQVDTTGFFDEAALLLGEHYEVLRAPLEHIRHAYRQEWTWVNIDLGNQPAQSKTTLKSVLRELYGHTFFTRYSYNKQKDSIGLGLQAAKPVRRFFDGGWLEWWTLMRLLDYLLGKGLEFSCARGLQIESSNDLRELDVVFLVRNEFPLVIECKSGEFRTDLEKCSNLRKRLGLHRGQFLLCNPDIDEEQAAGLAAMYGLTFVNLRTLIPHVDTLPELQRKAPAKK